MKDAVLDIQEACTLLKVSPATLYRAVRRGGIPGTKIGGQWRFLREDLLELLRRRETPRFDPAEPVGERSDHSRVKPSTNFGS